MLFLILIGLVVTTHACPQVVFASCLVTHAWLSKKQPTAMATSSYEAEYRAAFTATVECVWLRRLVADLGVGQETATTIYIDSWQLQEIRYFMLAQSTLRCITTMSGRDSLHRRDQLGLCANTGQPCRSIHKGLAS